MAYTFKLSHRLARLRTWGALAALTASFGCSDQNSDPLGLQQSTSPNINIASVEVAPSDLAGAVGESSQFTAIVRDDKGAVLTGRTIVWTSSDTTVTRITPSGVSTAVAAGSAKIMATSDGRTGSALTMIKALAPGVTTPGNVTDLGVSASADSNVTLTFTEVSNGNGQAATYLVRFAPSPMNWGTAATVRSGTCTSPMTGIGAGSRKICSVTGLSPATAYDFQVRAFRTPSGQDTVFGGLSNVAKGVTAGAIAVAVATVTLNPPSSSRQVGETTQYTATLKDVSGNVLTGRPVTWSTSHASIATVTSAGLATATGAGTATITATAEGKTGTGTLTASPPPASWPNEPSGYTQLVNQPFDALTSLGWSLTNSNGGVGITADGAAPFSPGQVLRFSYPAGYTGGGAPGTMYFPHGPSKEVYAGFWWKPSSPWQNHPSNVNKVAFWATQTWGSSLDVQMFGPAPYKVHVVTQFPGGTFRLTPNVTSTSVALGAWHRIEMHMKYASYAGGSDGIVEWWMDGVLQGRYTNVQTPSDAGFGEFQFSPTWGGLAGTKTENDYFLYDHVKLSRK